MQPAGGCVRSSQLLQDLVREGKMCRLCPTLYPFSFFKDKRKELGYISPLKLTPLMKWLDVIWTWP